MVEPLQFCIDHLYFQHPENTEIKCSYVLLAPREEARRERDCQAGEAHSVGESAGRTLPGEAPEVAGPEDHFFIKYHLFFYLIISPLPEEGRGC